jgi:Putative DNA-binding HTH domain
VPKSNIQRWARPPEAKHPLITCFPPHGREATVPFIGFAEAFVLSSFRRAGVPWQVLDLDEAEAARARIVIPEEPEMAPLPAGWGETLTGEPMPNIAAAIRRSRRFH